MILLMVLVVVLILGLCFGSFVNALVWRLHQQETFREEIDVLMIKKNSPATTVKITKLKQQISDRSISTGRSMCTDCEHTLAWYDLLPLISWLSVGGKCRYCRKPISRQYPIVELLTAALFIASYSFWPKGFTTVGTFDFSIWIVALTVFMALAVYDFRWMILPNRLVYPLIGIAAFQRLAESFVFHAGVQALVNSLIASLIGGGIFYILYQISNGNWIGGGDVKLGYALGFFVGTPLQAILLLMLASAVGILAALPTVLTGRFKRNLQIPFGPCLLIACVILVLFGKSVVNWYTNLLVS